MKPEITNLPDDEMPDELRARLLDAMRGVFSGDQRRIDHAMKVLAYAGEILAGENENTSPKVVVTAAILHDIGIPQAELKYGSAAGKYQEIEGPPIAREILATRGFDERTIEHVCRIIANHHSDRDIDTPEFRIIWDADWLVNIAAEASIADSESLRKRIEKVFKTSTGKRIAERIYLERKMT